MTTFTGVAAGDATQQSAVFWTRVESNSPLMAFEGGTSATDSGSERDASGQVSTPISLVLEIATDEQFRNVIARKDVETDPARDHIAKTEVDGLSPGTDYFYRWKQSTPILTMLGMISVLRGMDPEDPMRSNVAVLSPCDSADPTMRTTIDPRSRTMISRVGRLSTTPERQANVAVRFGHSGDADGLFAPYLAMQNLVEQDFDFFFNNGDTIYETASDLSPAVSASELAVRGEITQNRLLQDYYTKYRETHQPVSELIDGNTNPFPSLSDFYAAQGNFTTWDNHETGNRQLQSGGAPASLAALPETQGGRPRGGSSQTSDDVNTSGRYVNQLPSFRTIQQAFIDYQPIDPPLIDAPDDPRSHGTRQLYNARQWGRHALAINLDTRSYRDARLYLPDQRSDDSGERADNPARTMLGATQLAWLKQTLLDGQANGTTWTVISTSVPIDQVAPPGAFIEASGAAAADNPDFYNLNLFDDGKSWFGGYRSERDEILRFIADNNIRNVVFLASDQHLVRVNEVRYAPDPANPQQLQQLPGVFSMVTGPMGAGGPDVITDHSYANIEQISDFIADTQRELGVDPLGLDPAYPGLHDVWRAGNPDADIDRSPADFHSPDTFNYAAFAIGTDGVLDVELLGIPSYLPNTFPGTEAFTPEPILSFSITPDLS